MWGALLRVTTAGMAERGWVQLDPAASQQLGSAFSRDGPRDPKACAGSTVGEVRAFSWLCLLPHTALTAQAEMHPEAPPGTKGIPGSREVGYKGCYGSQVHAVTRMPFLSPRLTQIPARSWSQTQHDLECPDLCIWVHLWLPRTQRGLCTHPAPQHHWDTIGTLLGHLSPV